MEFLVKLARAGNVSIDWLATGKESLFSNRTHNENVRFSASEKNNHYPLETTPCEESDMSDSDGENVRFSKTESDSLAARLRIIIGGRKSIFFAKKCGFSDSLLGAYLRGEKKPGMDNLVAIAAAGNVTIDWLATGREPRSRTAAAAPQAAPNDESAQIAYIYSQASEPQRRAFRALAHAVAQPTLRAWLDLGVAVSQAADLTPPTKTQTQKKEP